MVTRWRNCFFREQKREILNDVKYIWNNSFLNCGCRWRMIIAVNLFMLCCSKQETNFYLSPTNHQSQCMIYVLFLIVHLHESWACSLSPLILKSTSHQSVQPSRSVYVMSYTAAITILKYVAIFQGLCIFTGNFITMIVFWIHRYKLKRTSFLLINLAVADLLAGLTQAAMAAQPIPQTISADISACFQAAFLAASLLFLVSISLERAYALIYPLRHRVTSTNAYIYTIIIVWLIAITWGTSCLLVVYDIFEFKFYMAALSFAILFCLVTICLCYVAIRAKLSQESPAIDLANNRLNTDRNTKLSKTFCIVISASVALWVPGLIFYCIYYFLPRYSVIVNYVSFILHQTNSLLNPIIYSLRMPFFKETFKRLKNKMKIRKQTKTYTVSCRTLKTET